MIGLIILIGYIVAILLIIHIMDCKAFPSTGEPLPKIDKIIDFDPSKNEYDLYAGTTIWRSDKLKINNKDRWVFSQVIDGKKSYMTAYQEIEYDNDRFLTGADGILNRYLAKTLNEYLIKTT
jgi:hypothetical protein